MRRIVRCTACRLNQYETQNKLCRRCYVPLPPERELLPSITSLPSRPLRGGKIFGQIGRVVAMYRMARGLQQGDLKFTGRSTISRLETGVFYPSIALLEKLADALEIPIVWLFEEATPDRMATLFAALVLHEVRERNLSKREVINLIGGMSIERTLRKAG
jgi:transcriptional regulator with XRE-family HTH domain